MVSIDGQDGINVYLIRRPVPFMRSTRSALQSEDYGHPGGHLSQRFRPEQCRPSTNEFSDQPGEHGPAARIDDALRHSGCIALRDRFDAAFTDRDRASRDDLPSLGDHAGVGDQEADGSLRRSPTAGYENQRRSQGQSLHCACTPSLPYSTEVTR
jgi:hypothetical protein